jgi:S-layer homology domain
MNRSSIQRKPLRASLLGIFSTLLLITTTLAASSANYAIYWSQLGASGGEGRTSTNYRLDSTIGLPANGVGTSANYVARLGYVPVQGAILTATPVNTPGGPTNTPRPTNTPVPTETPGGPTHTPTITPAPTDTPAGPTDTPGPPTDTPAPPTDTPQPAATPTDCANPFVDITGNVFYFAIHYLNCRSVISGIDPTHYGPAGTSTRGQFAKVVVLGFGLTLTTPPHGQDFTDVPPSYFAYVYIETGFINGILSGFDPASCTAAGAIYPCYLPNRAITRGQLTKLVVNAAHYPLVTPGTQTFTDVPPSNVFYIAIETAHAHGVINGYPDQTFRPNNSIRRDEMAQIVYKGVTSP